MKKLFWILLTGFLGISVPSLAQVTSVSILGVGSGGPGQSVPVTFVITNTNLFYDVNYDILFSPSSSVTNTAYSSFLKGPMVCSGDDAGYNFSSGTLATTIIQNATVPGYQYSGYVVVIADENQPYLTCASTSANTAFTMVPTPTATCTNTPTNTTTATATKTPTNTITQTPTATATNTITQTPTNTKTPTATATKTATNTATSTATNTATATPSSTPTAFFTYTITQTPTITNTPFYPQVNANVFVQVTATGTVTGQNVWIPQPPGWGGAGGITVSGAVSVTGGGVSVTGGQFVALQPTSTVTGTPTPTGSPTGTPTNTLTPGPISDKGNFKSFYFTVLGNTPQFTTIATVTIQQIGFVPRLWGYGAVASQPMTGIYNSGFNENINSASLAYTGQLPVTYGAGGLSQNTLFNWWNTYGSGPASQTGPGDFWTFEPAAGGVSAIPSVTATPVQTVEVIFAR